MTKRENEPPALASRLGSGCGLSAADELAEASSLLASASTHLMAECEFALVREVESLRHELIGLVERASSAESL